MMMMMMMMIVPLSGALFGPSDSGREGIPSCVHSRTLMPLDWRITKVAVDSCLSEVEVFLLVLELVLAPLPLPPPLSQQQTDVACRTIALSTISQAAVPHFFQSVVVVDNAANVAVPQRAQWHLSLSLSRSLSLFPSVMSICCHWYIYRPGEWQQIAISPCLLSVSASLSPLLYLPLSFYSASAGHLSPSSPSSSAGCWKAVVFCFLLSDPRLPSW